VTDNPFAVLTAVVPPAILTNACSVLALGTGNRVARVVDRSRALVTELAGLQPGSEVYRNRQAQILRLRRRSKLLLSALRILYASLGGFASCALISVVGAMVTHYGYEVLFDVAAFAALATGLAAVLGLVAGCAVMVAETRLALQGVEEAMDEALSGRPG
jgi:hypothetical protein